MIDRMCNFEAASEMRRYQCLGAKDSIMRLQRARMAHVDEYMYIEEDRAIFTDTQN